MRGGTPRAEKLGFEDAAAGDEEWTVGGDEGRRQRRRVGGAKKGRKPWIRRGGDDGRRDSFWGVQAYTAGRLVPQRYWERPGLA